ncbi:MAG: sulfatase, partial [Anaerolineales bacterium]|nr:sulfatase [Anaerolineales bacterium]
PLPLIPRRDFLTGAGLTFAALAAGSVGWQAANARRRLAGLPQLAVRSRPNVLLLVMDTVRAQSMSLHGYGRSTSPNLDRLAASGVRFDRAIASAPWTLPSHATMFTGRWHHELSADWLSPLDTAYPTLAEALRGQGYLTAGFVANVFYASYEHGLNRGFVHYEDYTRTAGEILAGASLGRTLGCWNRNEIGCQLRPTLGYYELLGRKTAARVNQEFLDWHAAQDGSRPFFAFLNYFDAHAPYLPPAPYDGRFSSGITRGNPMHINLKDWEWTPDQQQAEQDAYDSAIAYVDDQIGQLLAELEARGALENTLVLVTSDHGEEFGEHGVMAHSNSLYLPSLYVPLIAAMPGRVPAGLQVPNAFSLRDIPATVLDLLQIDGQSPFPGRSLARFWPDRDPAAAMPEPLISQVTGLSFRPAGYPVSKGTMLSVVLNHLHYIRRGDAAEELYDIDADPWETADLAATADGAARLAEFRAALADVPIADSM